VWSRLALVDVGSLSTVRSYAATCTTASAWVAAVALSSVFAIYGSKLSAIEINTLELGSVGVAAFSGVVLVFWLSGAALRAVAGVLKNTHPHTGQAAATPGAAQVATAFQESVRHAIPVMLLVTGIPVVLWTIGRLLLGGDLQTVAVVATGALVLGASVAGFILSLTADGIGNLEPFSPKSNRHGDKSVDVTKKWANNPSTGVAIEGDTLGSPLQSLVGPCIHALVKLLAAAALALAPLFY
ncbi:MAG: hypothetical protein CSA75_02340, partial [Sorangium cellulosum]